MLPQPTFDDVLNAILRHRAGFIMKYGREPEILYIGREEHRSLRSDTRQFLAHATLPKDNTLSDFMLGGYPVVIVNCASHMNFAMLPITGEMP